MVVADPAAVVVVGLVVHPNFQMVVVVDDCVCLVLVEEVAYSAYQTVVVLSAYQSPVYQQVVVAVPVYLN